MPCSKFLNEIPAKNSAIKKTTRKRVAFLMCSWRETYLAVFTTWFTPLPRTMYMPAL